MWVKERGEDMESVLLQLKSLILNFPAVMTRSVCSLFLYCVFIIFFPPLPSTPQIHRCLYIDNSNWRHISHTVQINSKWIKDPERLTLLEDM